MAFAKRSLARKWISTILSAAMVFSLIVIPAGAAEPGSVSGAINAGGTNLDTLVSQDATNGLSGTHSIEITGTLASQSVFQGKTGLGANATLLGSLSVGAGQYNDFKIYWGPAGAVDTSWTAAGFGEGTKVSDVIAKINSEVPTLTATLDGDGRITLTARNYGRIQISVSATSATGAGNALFGTNKVPGFEPVDFTTDGSYTTALGAVWKGGSDYGVNYAGVPVPFTITDIFESEGTTIVAGTYPGGIKLGSLNAFGQPIAAPTNGLYSLITLAPGYGLTLSTTGGKGIAKGKATVVVSNGVRDDAAPTSSSLSQASAGIEAGEVETITVSVTPTLPATAGWTAEQDTIDGLKIELPAGFVYVAGSAVATAAIGTRNDTATVAVEGQVLTLSNFKATNPDELKLQFRSKVPTTAGEYSIGASYRNVGGGGFKTFKLAEKVKVVGLNKVSGLRFLDPSPLYARAGASARIEVQPIDKFGNIVAYPRAVVFDTPDSAITVPVANTPAVGDGAGTYSGVIPQLKNAEGTAAVTFKVKSGVDTTTVEASGTISVSTVGVGAPVSLKVSSYKNPAEAGTAVAFRVQLVDAAGHSTAFKATDANKPENFTLNFGPTKLRGAVNGYKAQSVSVPVGSSDATLSLTSHADDKSWEMWVVDPIGVLAKSGTIVQTWTKAGATAGEQAEVAATPAFEGKPTYGYALANGTSLVEFKVKTGVPNQTIRVAPAADADIVGNNAQAGVLTTTTVKTDAAGIATVGVYSNTPSNQGNGILVAGTTDPPRYAKKFVFTNNAGTELGAGFAHFVTAEIRKGSVDKRIAFADGTEAATFSFTAVNPIDGAPAAGVKLYFAEAAGTTGSKLSADSAETNAQGVATVAVTRDSEASDVRVSARDFSGTTSYTSANGCSFVSYKLVVPGATQIEAQQSNDGAAVKLSLTLVDSTGKQFSFKKLENVSELSGTVENLKPTAAIDANTVAVTTATATFVGSDKSVAGDIDHVAFTGDAILTDQFGSDSTKSFGSDVAVKIVDNSSATARASAVMIGGNGNITLKGFRPNSTSVDVRLSENGSVVAVVETNDKGDSIQVSPGAFGTLLPGAYDLWVDGIRKPGALTVVGGFDIGVSPVYVALVPSSGTAYVVRGTKVTLSAAVADLFGHPIAGKVVRFFWSASADGSNKVDLGADITDIAGRATFVDTVGASGYYFAVSEGDGTYLAGNSSDYGRSTFVPVKTRASLSLTVPSSFRSGAAFTVKGKVPAHDRATRVYVYAYQKVGGVWKYKTRFATSIAAGATSFSKAVKVSGKGAWRFRIMHTDYNHVTSWSAYKYSTAK